ncbi:glycosyltransferase family 4 protein [Arthrobacter agilis]|uniref:MraY family glycosyltransferase n=1 Tax=Arthrobacter agilis TaxID=37921 RepID=UPI000B351DD8|nr:glycosyltransferase family 4 protein [Arthrobacter agilis]OUM44093.1 UDP-phosphate glycosyltransferase [Arthrobacter agilis]PPB46468.1 UDP-phosphate glycosyltransferase [Arthrobacter agilis]TPV23877.1 glycosyltransferase family 4 protein [Arthrobacter agilis]VDR32622.1 Undecaprenyl-phosphate alpha-N-acetylglucosaminyl 1-phosphate transferase [Arthrobacter agilis]
MSALLAVVGLVALALSLALPVIVKPLLRRLGVIDIPNDRSSHTTLVIRGMGVAVAAAILAGLALSLATGLVAVDRSLILIIFLMVGAASALGWIEDFRGLSVRVRLAVQLLIGAAGTAALATTIDESSYWWLPVGAIAVAAYINAANFMDGINGISGMHGVVVGAFYAWAGLLSDQMWLIVAGLVVAAAFAGFLPWNLGRGFVFLGDVGSYLLGASIAAIAVTGLLAGVYLEYLLSPVLIYLADTFSTFLRRARRGERLSAAHRQHVYQRLTDAGLTHAQVAVLVSVLSMLTGGAGFVLATAAAPLAVSVSLFAAAVVALYLSSPRIVRAVRGAVGRRTAVRG